MSVGRAPARDQLILDHLPMARCIAREVHATLPHHVDRSDLEQEGFVGLCRAADIYNPSRGAFRHIARRKVRGAIYDYLRSIDPLTRYSRDQVDAGLRDGVQVGPLDESAHQVGVRPEQERAAMDEERSRRLTQAVGRLRPEDALAVRRYQDSRISQMRDRVLLELRRFLAADGIRAREL